MTTFGLFAARFIGAVYLALGAWCAAAPRDVARRVGFSLESGSGVSEFITVYGGLEVGLGAALLLTSFAPALRDGGLVFGAVFSLALPLFRLATVMFLDVGKGVYGLFAAEILFAVMLAVPAWHAVGRPD
jgi:hypothetical protein